MTRLHPWGGMAAALLGMVPGVAAAGATATAPITLDDYFAVKRPIDLSLSADGRWLVYAVTEQGRRSVYLQDVRGGQPMRQAYLAHGELVGWLPNADALAFVVAGSGGVWQVRTHDLAGEERTIARLGQRPESVRFAPNGRDFAYLAPTGPEGALPLSRRLREGKEPVFVDPMRFSVYDRTHADYDLLPESRMELWVRIGDGPPSRADLPGAVTAFHWSPDSRSLSVVIRPRTPLATLLPTTSVGVLDVASSHFRFIAEAAPANGAIPALSFDGGEWRPEGGQLLLRRTTWRDPWLAGVLPDWAWAPASASTAARGMVWRRIEAYNATFFPLPGARLWMAGVLQAHPGLSVVTPSGPVRLRRLDAGSGANRNYTFSADGRVAAWTHERGDRPPEIFVAIDNARPRRLSRLNDALANKAWPLVDAVRWKSRDGVEISGWIMMPRGRKAGRGLPMVTLVHGGPGHAVKDGFLDYFRLWAYPLELMAARGMAVFIPNYRGTLGFGPRFGSPHAPDGEPVDDILTGIDALVARGVADAGRLGLAGHSHGGWLGPVIVTRDRRFKAASFANGGGNVVQTYIEMSGLLNRQVHAQHFGAGLYDDPQRFLRLSPDLNYQDVHTAVLYEAGADDQPQLFVSLPKAAQHFGAPFEFVVYPRQDHNLSDPAMMRASAELNSDWFSYWLSDGRDPDPAKRDRYARWDRLRERAIR